MKGRINQNRFLIGEAMPILIGRIIVGGDSPEYCFNNLLAIRGEGIKVGIKM